MANISDIARFRQLLGLSEEDWSDEEVSEYVDSYEDVDEAVYGYWQGEAANAVNLVNISESGSSRSMRDAFDNRLKMAEFYRKQKEDEQTETEVGISQNFKLIRE